MEAQDLSKKLLLASGIGMLFDAMDVGLLGFVIAALILAWHISPQSAGLLGSITLVGMALGSAGAGLYADRVGRKKAFLITLLIYSFASGISAFATSIGFLIVMRFITGFGLGGELPVATTFVLESSPPEKRGGRTALLETFWAFGSIVAALIGYLLIPLFTWRAAFAITVFPALYALYLRRTLPETPAFKGLKQTLNFKQNMVHLWQAKLRKRTILLWVLWFTANFAYYGMFFWLPSVLVLKGYSLIHSFGYVLIMAIAQVPGYLASAWLVEKIGRKWTLVLFSLVSAISALLFGLSNSLTLLLLFGVILNFSNLGAWGATYVFSVEQYPPISRATGLGWAMGIGKIGGVVAPYLVGALVAAKTPFAHIFSLFFIVTLIGVVVLLTLGKDVRTDESAFLMADTPNYSHEL
ncbi:MFS transporter [Sulfoacidibacillus thermotolerans]|uniref:MFS transporter n=1 Tax=Sulfoacidibacillus thermotolerans TaxID=1765684 RepID=UPI002482A9A6|nr:MFS transporter [Sulfoacidibacillus thermotolerans]